MLQHRAPQNRVTPIQGARIVVGTVRGSASCATPVDACIGFRTRISVVARRRGVLVHAAQFALAHIGGTQIPVFTGNLYSTDTRSRTADRPGCTEVTVIARVIVKHLIDHTLAGIGIARGSLTGTRPQKSELAISIHHTFTGGQGSSILLNRRSGHVLHYGLNSRIHIDRAGGLL